MKLTELIEYAQNLLNENGDHEITRTISGVGNQCKPVKFKFQLDNNHFIKRKTVTEHEEITVKRREPLYRLTVEDDVK